MLSVWIKTSACGVHTTWILQHTLLFIAMYCLIQKPHGVYLGICPMDNGFPPHGAPINFIGKCIGKTRNLG